MFRNFLLLVFFASLALHAQDQNKPLVKISDEKISPDEFRYRYELSPFINTSLNDDSVKYHFLLSLIAEKLFAIEAKKIGLEETEKFMFAYTPLEKMYVRDALFEREIKSKVKIDNEQILDGIKKYTVKLNVLIFGSADSSKIYKIYNELSSGVSLDSLSSIDEKDSSEITFGIMNDEALEDSLFLLSNGEYTKPIKTELGWFIFYLKDKIRNVIPEDSKDVAKKVEEIIKNRQIEKAYYNYMRKVFKDKTIEADRDLFLTLSENIFSVLKEKKAVIADTLSQINMDETDFENLKAKLGNEFLDKTFFKADDKNISINDFLADLLLAGFSVNALNQNEINYKLSSLSKDFMEKEYLVALGYKQGLQNLPEVKEELEIWKDSYLSKIYKNTLIDSARVNDEEVYNYFLESQKGDKVKQVNIVEMLTDSLETIEYVLNQINDGKDFKELAVNLTKREWVKKRGGEFGLFPVTMFGEIGRIANTMKIGDIYGPLKVDEGYSIFKLIDVKETEDSVVQSFADVKERMKNELMYKKFNDALTKKTIELAHKYKISIDERVFNSIDLMKIKMFVYRFMGFGGRITAVPLTAPWFEWIYENETSILP